MTEQHLFCLSILEKKRKQRIEKITHMTFFEDMMSSSNFFHSTREEYPFAECLLLDWLVISKQNDIEAVYRLVEGSV